MKRIAIGGLHHETNTFSPELTDYQQFEHADNWPGLSKGDEIFQNFADCNIPISGFIKNAKSFDIECVPLLWAAAEPAGPVTEEAYEKIVQQLLLQLDFAKNNIDGIFLDLHGAMVTTHLDDAEGELLKRIRKVVGKEMPIVISLDFHANVTREMLEHSNLMYAYQTYPHVDMAETGKQCANAIAELVESKPDIKKAQKHLDFLIPLIEQCTLTDVWHQIYKTISNIENSTGAYICFTPGFALSDVKDAGPAVSVYAKGQQYANTVTKQIVDALNQFADKFQETLYSVEDAIQFIQKHKQEKPVIFADTQDNPGAGGSSDTTGIFTALVNHNINNAVVAIMHDPEVAKQAHAAGKNAEIDIKLGAKSPGSTEQPFVGKFTVKKITDGKFTGTGLFYKGCKIQLGPMALLEHNGVEVIVSSHKMQAADQAIFRHMGIDPKQKKLLVLKSSVHFRADFNQVSDDVLIVVSAGKNTADLTKLDYQKCKRKIASGIEKAPA